MVLVVVPMPMVVVPMVTKQHRMVLVPVSVVVPMQAVVAEVMVVEL